MILSLAFSQCKDRHPMWPKAGRSGRPRHRAPNFGCLFRKDVTTQPAWPSHRSLELRFVNHVKAKHLRGKWLDSLLSVWALSRIIFPKTDWPSKAKLFFSGSPHHHACWGWTQLASFPVIDVVTCLSIGHGITPPPTYTRRGVILQPSSFHDQV